jgi:hypothetical protein
MFYVNLCGKFFHYDLWALRLNLKTRLLGKEKSLFPGNSYLGCGLGVQAGFLGFSLLCWKMSG